MAGENLPQPNASDEQAATAPVDLTLFRPEEPGYYKFRLSSAGSVDRETEGPDAVTVDSEVSVVESKVTPIEGSPWQLRRTRVQIKMPQVFRAIEANTESEGEK